MTTEERARLGALLRRHLKNGPWHCGRTVGRTIYTGDGPDDLIGIMDNRELAELVVLAVNYWAPQVDDG